MYNQNKSCVHILGTKLTSFTVRVGLRQGCPLSPILLVIFMDRISRRREEGVWFGNLRVASLLFANYVILLASSSQDLQCAMEQFVVECKAAGMKIDSWFSTGKRWNAPSGLGVSPCSRQRSLSIWVSCSPVMAGWSKRWTDGLGLHQL